jgi:hypothetical protein
VPLFSGGLTSGFTNRHRPGDKNGTAGLLERNSSSRSTGASADPSITADAYNEVTEKVVKDGAGRSGRRFHFNPPAEIG